ncbi:DUF4097 domain-containing protein [Acidicapsa dinghuensis]|uniref:DUF4097 domain-containing protein n=1 Tax=Acidicapsa dinghuensis TaxID=2218256 RepID=A0ABW1EH74_9BACT|nr:DUF4097 domain-containing protein [Acidicapsa dinghuensis]
MYTSYPTSMKTIFVPAALFVLATTTMFAQDSEHSWSKTYQLSGKPTLVFETGDAGVEIHSCGGCREIRIHVAIEGKNLSDYRLEESQTGDQVQFKLHEREHLGFHIDHRQSHTQVSVETPAQLNLQAKTSDGSVAIDGLNGQLELITGDGSVTLDHLSGDLHLKSSDGPVRITDFSGALDAHTSDGSLNVDGVFHALTVHSGDASVDVNLRPGTKLTSASTIQTSDGQVTIRVPGDFAADLEVHTSDGHVDCALPLTMDGYHSNGGDSHQLRGRINGGGTLLTIHTSDGNVKIESI